MIPKRIDWVVFVLTILLLILGSLLIISFIIDYANSKYTIDKLEEQVAMQELYYEVKLDYFEERYNIDLDETPNDFILYLYENYPELYEYLMEVEE